MQPVKGIIAQLFSVSPSIGEEFDPEVHEAVMRVPRAQMPDAEPNTIAFIQKTGYNIKDQVALPVAPLWLSITVDFFKNRYTIPPNPSPKTT